MKEYVDLFYKDLEITIATDYHPPVIGGAWGGEPGWTEMEQVKVDYTYTVERELIVEALNSLVEPGFYNFEELVDKHQQELLDIFKDRAIEEAEDNYDYGCDDLEPLEIKESEIV